MNLLDRICTVKVSYIKQIILQQDTWRKKGDERSDFCVEEFSIFEEVPKSIEFGCKYLWGLLKRDCERC